VQLHSNVPVDYGICYVDSEMSTGPVRMIPETSVAQSGGILNRIQSGKDTSRDRIHCPIRYSQMSRSSRTSSLHERNNTRSFNGQPQRDTLPNSDVLPGHRARGYVERPERTESEQERGYGFGGT
jgi:hypothetical protein